MKTRCAARALAFAVAAASLPGCVTVIDGDRPRVETPTQEKLTSLEKRMDRVEDKLAKKP
jgi:hypothetical protein